MVEIAWGLWIVILGAICLIFWRLWKYATKIEELEQEEQQWIEYLDWMWQTDPHQAQFYQQMFEEKYLK